LGNFHFQKASIIYSYHLPVGATGLLGVGAEGTYVRTTVTNYWTPPSGQIINDSSTISSNFNMGLGAYYRATRLYLGLSVSKLLPQKLCTSFGCDYSTMPNYYLMAGYNIPLSQKINAEPSVFLKSDAVVTTFDANLLLKYANRFWIGASYRLQDAVCFMGGIAVNPNMESTIKIGYTYDLGISALRFYHHNTHEILISYCFRKNKTQHTPAPPPVPLLNK
jgi:type IX secretion system PorP/SprF family membrane protein